MSPPYRYVWLAVEVADRSALERPFRVRWERLVGDVVATSVWENSLTDPPTKLTHIPNFGTFHRLVIATPHLAWDDDFVLRVDDVLIRLVTGSIYGEKIEPLDQVDEQNGQVFLSGAGSGSATVKGRFVEVTAPGRTPEEAEMFARSLLGLVALVLGPHTVGDVVFSEPYTAKRHEQLGTMRIPVKARIPRQAGQTEVHVVHTLLPHLLMGDRSARGRSLALAWYERALRAESALDELLSCIIGIEALISTYASTSGPVPEALQREERLRPVAKDLKAALGTNDGALAIQRLVEPTLTEKFRYYGSKHGLASDLVDDFQRLAGLRNDAVHGRVVVIEPQDTNKIRDILLAMIKAEFGLLGPMAWQKVPTVTHLGVEYKLVDSDPRDGGDQPGEVPDSSAP